MRSTARSSQREPTAATAVALGEVWRGLRRGAVFPANPLTGLVGFLGRSDHLVPGGHLQRIIARNLDVDRLEQMRVPLHVIVTDVLTGRELRLSHGPAVEAVLASAAIPGVCAPVEIDGRRLIDGGVSDNTPISHAMELGAEEIYVLPTGYACAQRRPPRGALAMLLHAMSLLVQQRLHLEVELYRDRAQLIALPPPCPQDVQPIDFSHAGDLIDRALSEKPRVSGLARARPISRHRFGRPARPPHARLNPRRGVSVRTASADRRPASGCRAERAGRRRCGAGS